MKKVILIILSIIVFLAILTIFVNHVIIPTKVKSYVVDELSKQIGKEVSLRDLRFSLFKGLVLKDLSIFDKHRNIIKIKQANCTFLIWPFGQKKIIISVHSRGLAVPKYHNCHFRGCTYVHWPTAKGVAQNRAISRVFVS